MIKLPEMMQRQRSALAELNVPIPGATIPVNMDMLPSQIAAEMLRVGGILAYLEYMLGQNEAARIAYHEQVDQTLLVQMLGTDAKQTIRAREAAIIAGDPALQMTLGFRTQSTVMVEQVKGLRNAYRAQYDALSRVLSAKQLEADVSR